MLLDSRKLSLAFAALGITLSVAGCTSSTDETGSQEGNVTSSRCPDSFTIHVAQPTIFQTVPATYFDNRELSAAERERVKTAMDAARSLGEQELTFSNPVREADTCTYSSGDSSVVLRTKDGRDRLDLSNKSYRAYMYLSAYSTNGVTFESPAPTSFFANIAADSQTDAALNVRIGKTTITEVGVPLPPRPQTKLRVPVLEEGGNDSGLLHDTDPSFPKTIELDASTGYETFEAIMNRAEEAGYELVRYASPNAYETSDPATSICFSGPEDGVCNVLESLTDNLLGDMFGIAEECHVTHDKVSFDYFISESDHTSFAEIPRCR